MASNNLSPNYVHSIGAAVAPSSDPTVDLKTLVTALESLLNLAQSQLNLPTSSSTPDSSARLDSLSIDNTSSPPNASSTKSKASSNNPDSGQGEPESLPYVDGALGRTSEEEEERVKAWEETESHVKRKLIEIHSKLKNGCIPWDEDESMLLEQDTAASEDISRHRKFSHHEPQNNIPPHHPPDGDDQDEDEGETDEGTVSDPSPSPHLSKATITSNTSKLNPLSIPATTGPGSETAEAMISQTVRILDADHGFASETKALAAQLLAELAKTLNGRSLCLHYRTTITPNLRMNQRRNDTGEARDDVKPDVSVVEAVSSVLGPNCPLETSVQVQSRQRHLFIYLRYFIICLFSVM